MQGSTAVKRLNVIVPYRDRPAHLNAFVPLLRAYFARDKIDRNIPYRVFIVEQDSGMPFNRGALCNIGFVLGREDSDYTCFHDVDYLPIWADYSWSDTPAGIVWHGAETRPWSLKHPGRRAGNKLEDFFGGVALTPNALFEQVNGYSNTYWGWGWEDTDLKHRYQSVGITVTRRKGSFQALDHDHCGYTLNDAMPWLSPTPKPTTLVNERHFNERWAKDGTALKLVDDGLTTLAFDVLDRRPVPEGPVVERAATWEVVKIRLNMKPPD
jgi:hypothetical protein